MATKAKQTHTALTDLWLTNPDGTEVHVPAGREITPAELKLIKPETLRHLAAEGHVEVK